MRSGREAYIKLNCICLLLPFCNSKNYKKSSVQEIYELSGLELYEVFSRPKFLFKYRIDRQEIDDIISSIALRAERVTLKGTTKLCRDPDDDIIIETAIRGRAKYLVTGDKDITNDKTILSFLSRHGVSFISLSRFLALIDKS
jgi:putative PIN family toxin of toxin-antitoxin system